MNDAATNSLHRPPMMLRDVFLVLLAMVLFLFALQPHEHAHGGRRREGEPSVAVHAVEPAPEDRGCWRTFEAELSADCAVHTASGARH